MVGIEKQKKIEINEWKLMYRRKTIEKKCGKYIVKNREKKDRKESTRKNNKKWIKIQYRKKRKMKYREKTIEKSKG